jgi:two-component system sensor histidine kinase QseC
MLLLTLASVVAVAMLTAWMAYREAEHEVDELIDGQLVQYARIMLALAHAGDDEEAELPHIDGHRYASRVIFQIWQRDDDDGDTLLLRSPESPPQWPAGVHREGYSDLQLNGSAWRCFAASDDEKNRYTLAAIDLHIRDELVQDIAMGNLRPYLYGLPILALLLIWAIRSGLAPLRRLESDLAGRSPDRLDPFSEDRATRELLPLIQTMNRLFGRVKRTLENEKRFTSDASHELRTPLAAVKAQLQVAARTQDAAEGQGAIAKALRGTDRMGHLVAQLLSLARLESGQPQDATVVSLSELAAEAVSEAGLMAERQQLTLEAMIQPEQHTLGNRDLLGVLLRNLIDNALRYTPPSGRVRLILAADNQQRVCLSVLDDGSGVALADRARLGERFQRLGRRQVEGVGLGLSIVRRIADMHQAELAFTDGLAGAGFGVSVCFPSA